MRISHSDPASLILVIMRRAEIAVEQIGDGGEASERRIESGGQDPLAESVVEAKPRRRSFVAVFQVQQANCAVRLIENPHL